MRRWVWPLTAALLIIAGYAHMVEAPGVLVFLFSALAIIPLAGLMGRSTEAIAAHAGPRVGGLLSATFGNAVELIIGIIALNAGMSTLVKASITGSILGNLLFVLGVSFFVGGIRHPIQRFNIRAARSNASMLMLSVGVAFIVPAIFSTTQDVGTTQDAASLTLSTVVALVSLVLYLSGLYFALFTHREVFESINQYSGEDEAHWRLWPAIGVLLVTTVCVALASEWLVGSIEELATRMGWSEVFMGVVIVAIVGNAAEHASAVWMAWKNRMDLSLEIAVGSTLQVAMFVAPVLFLASLVLGHAMPLIFSWPELASMGAAVLLVVVLMMDGESNWLEGALALGAYLVMAVGFYTLPSML
ncbi:calcium/proton exchanger [Alicyclobacillus sp.]|uniref:calcium/proton exchanger n=1 Tax=Alicyclobacillus sp. TaxID=61169 RepID=UPI0025C369A9|nr:calcium/proton exchanger [Alicyclobacillus sp.]MCL6516571.1 calcium/proton exchanger [Alicyclobacillus sp.]